jgi:hypothetical protein
MAEKATFCPACGRTHTGLCEIAEARLAARKRAAEERRNADDARGLDRHGGQAHSAPEATAPPRSEPLAGDPADDPARCDPRAVQGIFPASELAKPGFDKTAYQRAYMKAWRAKRRQPE